MYPIMGGQLPDLAASLRQTWQMREFMEQSERERTKFRQQQEECGGRAVSPQAMTEAEQLLNAHAGNPPQAAIDRWERRFGKGEWDNVVRGMKTGEGRGVGRSAFAALDKEFEQTGMNLILALKEVDESVHQRRMTPEMGRFWAKNMKDRAANRVDYLMQNPEWAGNPDAMRAANRAKTDFFSMPTFSVGAPPAIAPPAAQPPTLPALQGMPPPGTGQGGFNLAPPVGAGPGGPGGVNPETILMILEALSRRQGGGAGTPGFPQSPGLQQFPGMPLFGPGTGYSPGHTPLR